MPLSYPIAKDARAALDAVEDARTIGEARERAGRAVTLVSEWLRPLPAEAAEIGVKTDAGLPRGFVQLYEDARGRPVIAVTFWKPAEAASRPSAASRKRRAGATPAGKPALKDHTDDLYFAKASSRTKPSARTPDPRQLDLFAGPGLPAPRDEEVDPTVKSREARRKPAGTADS
ncbi:MAG: hypothetical protein SGJ21_12950 [Alphaproteobacteria bacterium]|nr:hypothetical protein [Alphaproteobacteria bacterium]